ncbi:MAG: hypothetical protein AB1750_15880, partial [Chloroflexota bacterium]
GLFTAIALMTLCNGIFNIIWGLGLTFGTFLLCLPLGILPITLGAFEIAYAAKLLANPPQPVQPSPAIAWWEIAAILVGNVFSMVVGILALVFYNDQAVKDYFAGLNATPVPPPTPTPPQAAPVQPTESAPAPAAPEVPAEPAIEEAPAVPEPPAKPKRVRKAAKK